MNDLKFKLILPNKRRKINENLTKDCPSKHGFSFNDLSRICVYEHLLDDNVFYVGQGSIQRAFNFLNRNKLWKQFVGNRKSEVVVKIIKIDITIEESIKLETELIEKYGRLDDNTGILVNGNDGDSGIGQKGENNYFFNKKFVGSLNANFGNKYNKNINSIPIIQLNIFGEIVREWSSATEAEEIGGFCAGPISGCCNHKRYIHKGFQWIYKKDYDENKNYEYSPGRTNNRIYLCFDKFGNFVKYYNNGNDLITDGFNPKNVSQVCNGNKKSHKGHTFIDFFKLDRESKQKVLDEIGYNLFD